MFDTFNIFHKESEYKIYELYNNKAESYYLTIPNNDIDTFEIYVAFPKKDISSLSQEEIINEIKEINDLVIKSNPSSIYILPNIKVSELTDAANENDFKLYNELLSHIHTTLSDTYDKIGKHKNIKQKITFIKQTNSDSKFINWLETNMNNYINSISINSLKRNNTKEKEEIKSNNILEQTNPKTKKLTPEKLNNHGFSNFINIILLLIICVSVSFIISFFIIKIKSLS